MIKTIVGDSVAVKGYTKFMTVDKCFGGNSNNIVKENVNSTDSIKMLLGTMT